MGACMCTPSSPARDPSALRIGFSMTSVGNRYICRYVDMENI